MDDELMSVRFNMIGLFVSDLERMAHFYEHVVGLSRSAAVGQSYIEFSHEGIRFSMYERSQLPKLLGIAPDFPTAINGTFELAINVGAPANVDVTFERFTKEGAKPVYPPRDEPWKMRSAMVADPDGNLIEIASDLWE